MFSPPTLDELFAASHVVSLPMRTKFRGVMEREVMLFDGPAGWSEFGPFLEYGDLEAVRWLASAVEAGWLGYPEPVRQWVPINATLPAVPVELVPEVLGAFDGVHTVKIKVAEPGESLRDDAARVGAVRHLLPEAKIRIDANAGWTVPQAVAALRMLSVFDLEYAEQPVATVPEMAAVRRAMGGSVLIAADESVRKVSDPLAVARAGAADLIVVKAAPLGGVGRALDIVAEAGLPAVVSSALDSSVGIRTGLALAAALPELPFACGLGTVALMAGDVTGTSLLASVGGMSVRDVTADPDRLEYFAAAPERQQWWRERLRRCQALL
ncbi:O-succinylbenzoate synthase [Arthrobacter stackebrandtii]|uniref:o-succinylbenzoate synthase n=1 Tax=Arthrobacter stackebrandtii TaxID=272161 RepID=A0ABS4YWG1_9MICC|nr:o-succinylbenzoate synthase [Arthrobacter stackebrandtii]MBP2413124.1 O-succinylbenzoate synthase [Arthrobacter stackebrandtii]PYH01109.1 O-succinylbenzoate synthase [Arthrobacter stackebrandtii]